MPPDHIRGQCRDEVDDPDAEGNGPCEHRQAIGIPERPKRREATMDTESPRAGVPERRHEVSPVLDHHPEPHERGESEPGGDRPQVR